jgi:hypothetical protein
MIPIKRACGDRVINADTEEPDASRRQTLNEATNVDAKLSAVHLDREFPR